MVAHKRNINLRNLLVPSAFTETKPLSVHKGQYQCGHCSVCLNVLPVRKVFIHPITQKRFYIDDFSNCDTTHVIYIIQCPCSLLYVGKTKRNIRVRIIEHKSCIRRRVIDKPLVQHWIDQAHTLSDLKFCVIKKVRMNWRGGNRENTTSDGTEIYFRSQHSCSTWSECRT